MKLPLNFKKVTTKYSNITFIFLLTILAALPIWNITSKHSSQTNAQFETGIPEVKTVSANTIEILVGSGGDDVYTPSSKTITAGTTVIWKRVSGSRDVLSYGTPNFPSSGFPMGATYQHTFTQPGTYKYRCTPHSSGSGSSYTGMIGTIIVTAAATNTPNPTTKAASPTTAAKTTTKPTATKAGTTTPTSTKTSPTLTQTATPLPVVKAEVTTTPTDSNGNRKLLKVKIVDRSGQPVVGAKVQLDRVYMNSVSDKNGIAEFKNVPNGQYSAAVTYNKSKQNVPLIVSGDAEELEVKAEIKNKSRLPMFVLLIALALIISAIVGGIYYYYRKKNAMNQNRSFPNPISV